MADQEHRPLFIFGCPRSGTSLLTRMLHAHPNIAIPYESHLYNRVYPIVHRSSDLKAPHTRARLVEEILQTDYVKQWDPPPSLPETLAAFTRPDFHGVVDGLMRAWTVRQGKSRWGEKTPQHTLWWRTIFEGFPDLQVIHVVRDGRDVALSYRDAHFGPKHVYHLARRWVKYLSAAEDAQQKLGEPAFLTVRYEDLLGEPEQELERICAFLGEAYRAEMLTFYQGQVAYPTDRRNEDNLRRPVLKHNIEKWRTQMSARELRIFEALAHEQLERYGYASGRTVASLILGDDVLPLPRGSPAPRPRHAHQSSGSSARPRNATAVSAAPPLAVDAGRRGPQTGRPRTGWIIPELKPLTMDFAHAIGELEPGVPRQTIGPKSRRVDIEHWGPLSRDAGIHTPAASFPITRACRIGFSC